MYFVSRSTLLFPRHFHIVPTFNDVGKRLFVLCVQYSTFVLFRSIFKPSSSCPSFLPSSLSFFLPSCVYWDIPVSGLPYLPSFLTIPSQLVSDVPS